MRHHPSWREVRHDYMRDLVPIDATCAVCRWWHPWNGSPTDPAGYCHFNPPTAQGWPQTGSKDVCSAWETDYNPVPRTNAA
jgi:hypothetical protein